MMRFDPTIIVTRLVVKRKSLIAYDEKFHTGVNIVRGENSSGKSTVLNFLFYGLGGDLSRQDWSDHALLCTDVWLEAELNGKCATFRRDISETSQTSMNIFGGDYEAAVVAPIDQWIKYPYARSRNKESFSQAIFRLLGMPDVAVEGTSNVTVHQVLRLLYADQLTSIDSLFRFEGYDPEILRETIGNLLCGAFDTEIYELQQTVRSKERAYTEAVAELKSITRVIGSDESVGVQWVEQQKESLLAERNSIIAQTADAESDFYSKKDADAVTLSAQKTIYAHVQELQRELQLQRQKVDALRFDIADSSEFIRGLHRKLESLKDAELAASIIESIQFGTCPACFAEIEPIDQEASACHLCKTPLDSERAKGRIVGIINEINIQLKQSEFLQGERKKRLPTLNLEFSNTEVNWKAAAKELSALSILPTSEARTKIRDLHRSLGYIDRSIEDIDKKLEMAHKLAELRQKKYMLNEELEELKLRITKLKNTQTEQLKKAKRLVERQTIDLLKRDLHRQDSFENPESVVFSFAKNNITVDGHTYFSASSRVILKSSFLVAFLAASMKDKSFRHPRFLMIDITEDKGMEVERSHNFQQQVVRVSEESAVEHQVILATAMPSPEIDDELLVGKFSTRDSGTLNILN